MILFTLGLLLSAHALGSELSKQKWISVKTTNFVVLSNASERQAREAAIKLEEFRVVVQKALPNFHLNSAEPTIVFAVHDEDSMKALLPAVADRKGIARPVGVFMRGWEQSHAVLRLDLGENSYEVIRHEYFHNLESLNFVSLPVWLNEGLAEFFGNSEIDEKQAKLGMPSIRLRTLRNAAPIPLKVLLTADSRSAYYTKEDKVGMFYAQSWLLTHMLITDSGMGNGAKMDEFIKRLHKDPDQVAVFQQVFGDIKTVENEFSQYLSRFAMNILVLHNPPQINVSEIAVSQLSPTEAEIAISDFFRATHRRKEAEQYLEEASKGTTDLSLAHRVKAFLAFDEGKDEQALAEFEKAVALDPKDYLSLYYETMMRFGNGKSGDPKQVLAEMKKVRGLNPTFAPAHVEIARAYQQVGQLEDANAAAGYATQLEPGRAGYYLKRAEISLNKGDAASAAALAHYVADRWYGTDRDQAIEIWKKAVASDAKLGSPALDVQSDAPEGATVEGVIESVKCEEKKPFELKLKSGNNELNLSPEEGKGFRMGFEDTVWYGSDHFNMCHHIDGRSAAVVYKPIGEDKGTILQIRVKD